jgi:hypothetical protein
MSPPLQSLVRYENPSLVSLSKDKGRLPKDKAGKKVQSRQQFPISVLCYRVLPDVIAALICTGTIATSRAKKWHHTDRGHPELHPATQVLS